MSLAPRVLLILKDQWLRASLRAALCELGYDAVGARGISEALRYPKIACDRGAVELVIIEKDALDPQHDEMLQRLVRKHDAPPMLLLAHSVLAPPAGSWARILRRPMAISDVMAAAQSLLPLADRAAPGRACASPAMRVDVP
jgi:hypothetical protein